MIDRDNNLLKQLSDANARITQDYRTATNALIKAQKENIGYHIRVKDIDQLNIKIAGLEIDKLACSELLANSRSRMMDIEKENERLKSLLIKHSDVSTEFKQDQHNLS